MTNKMKGILRAGVKIREHLQGPARQLPRGVLPRADLVAATALSRRLLDEEVPS